MRNQKGFSLIDVILAVALTGILGVTIPGTLSIANRTTIIGNESTMAESLARSQMDYVQNQPYNSENTTPVYTVLTDLPTGYSITQTVERLNPKGDDPTNDDGLQQITVNVKHGTDTVHTLICYKNRLD